MHLRYRTACCFALLAAVGAPIEALASDPSTFLGTWRIAAGLASSPGDSDSPAPPDPDLLGKDVVFAEQAIEAPHPLGCGNAVYEVRDLPAEALFQGTLGSSASPRAVALDLSPDAAPTLMVQCDTGVFDYHLTQGSGDAAPKLLIMLDHVIYTLERDSPPPR